jgi:hypothetical protein
MAGEMVGSKQLFPIIEGPVENPTNLVTYSVCSNGLFMTKKVCGRDTVTTKIDGIKGLPEGKEEINILPRKIPVAYFWKIVEFFRHVAKNMKTKVEAYILLGYNFNEDKFCLYVPQHKVTGASVSYDIEKFWKDNPDYYCVLDAHLHPGFGAFWSTVDDTDDKRDRFSMVIGKQDSLIPEHKLRFAAGKRHIDVTLDELFEDSNIQVQDFDCAEAMKNIKVENLDRGFTITSGDRSFSLYDSYKYKLKKEFTLRDLVDEDEKWI